MKKIVHILVICFLCTGLSANAQKKRINKQRIKALKVAHITEELNLTPEEAEKFWPIYNLHDEKLHSYREQSKDDFNKMIAKTGDINDITNKQAEILINLKLFIDKKIYEEHKSFVTQLSKILSYKKILKLHTAERDFKRKLIRKLRKKGKSLKEKKGSN
jgi:hypothetical protein